jgi:orotidine-5'-phosphate decarboxylase
VVRGGATHLVVGRPISRADDPAAAFDAIAREIAAA